jgi:hypothetical protein
MHIHSVDRLKSGFSTKIKIVLCTVFIQKSSHNIYKELLYNLCSGFEDDGDK